MLCADVVLFAPAFPVASLVCYVSFLLEIRTDAYKLLYNTQRPRYAGAQDIGSWQHVLTFIAVVGVFTNIGIIGYTSSALSSALPLSFFGLFEVNDSNKALFLVALEHMILTTQFVVMNVVPDRPEQLSLLRARTNWRKKATIELAKAELGKPVVVDGNLAVHPPPVPWVDEAIPERFWKERGWDVEGFYEPRRGNELAKLLKAGEHKQAEEQRLRESERSAGRLEQARLEHASLRLHKLEMASRRTPVKIKGVGDVGGSVTSRVYAMPYEPVDLAGSQSQRLLGSQQNALVLSDDLNA